MTYDVGNPALDYMNDAVKVLDTLASRCHSNAVAHGFYEADALINQLLDQIDQRVVDSNCAKMRETHEQNACLKRHALIVSEVGELTEAVRKPSEAHHINEFSDPSMGTIPGACLSIPNPPFTQEEEEAADTVIRLFDYAGFRKLRLGAAILAKMKFNESRPYMHGKRS